MELATGSTTAYILILFAIWCVECTEAAHPTAPFEGEIPAVSDDTTEIYSVTTDVMEPVSPGGGATITG